MALIANYLNDIHWGIIFTFLAAYFTDVHDLPKSLAGIPVVAINVSYVIGSNIGGQLGDRNGRRTLIVGGRLVDALFKALLTAAAKTPAMAFLFLVCASIANGNHYTNAQAMLSEMAPRARGTIMALTNATMNFGVVTGSLIGSLIINVTDSYTLLGPAAAVASVTSAAVFWAFVQEPASPTQREAALAVE
jgi:predicted MFS family arabinose efflux permease